MDKCVGDITNTKLYGIILIDVSRNLPQYFTDQGLPETRGIPLL